jgi:rubrerythrin
MTRLKKRLAEDIEDEHQGAKTYAARARQLDRADDDDDARTVRKIRRDEVQHGKTLRRMKRRLGRAR